MDGLSNTTSHVIEEGKNKFPNDFVLNVEEFNFWYNKGDNDKAQQALQNAIEADPSNKILHFNIGVTYDNLAKTEHEAKNHEKAFEYIEKAVTALRDKFNYKSLMEVPKVEKIVISHDINCWPRYGLSACTSGLKGLN